MMKVKAFKWTSYHTVKATESVFVLKVPMRGKGNASGSRVRSCGALERRDRELIDGVSRTAFFHLKPGVATYLACSP